jgi:hypothetical protein
MSRTLEAGRMIGVLAELERSFMQCRLQPFVRF